MPRAYYGPYEPPEYHWEPEDGCPECGCRDTYSYDDRYYCSRCGAEYSADGELIEA